MSAHRVHCMHWDNVRVSNGREWHEIKDSRSWGNMQESQRANGVQTIPKGDERATLREQHEETVKTLEEVRVFVRFEELQA